MFKTLDQDSVLITCKFMESEQRGYSQGREFYNDNGCLAVSLTTGDGWNGHVYNDTLITRYFGF